MTTTSTIDPTEVTVVPLGRFLGIMAFDRLVGRYVDAEVVDDDGNVDQISGVILHASRAYFGPTGCLPRTAVVRVAPNATTALSLDDVEESGLIEVTAAEAAEIDEQLG